MDAWSVLEPIRASAMSAARFPISGANPKSRLKLERVGAATLSLDRLVDRDPKRFFGEHSR